MKKYFKSSFEPRNIILLGSMDYQRKIANQIVQEAAMLFPELFNGKRASFSYELRYVPPFDKAFNELKRLQGIAAEEAGFRDEFRGYIVMDVSPFITHETDEYFIITLKFLYDMADCWNYIFLVDDSNRKAALDLVREVLLILEDVPCRVIEEKEDKISRNAQYINEVCKEYGITCSIPVQIFLKNLLDHNDCSRQVVTAIIHELSIKFGTGNVLSMIAMCDYFGNGVPNVKYMLTAKQYESLLATMKGISEEIENDF